MKKINRKCDECKCQMHFNLSDLKKTRHEDCRIDRLGVCGRFAIRRGGLLFKKEEHYIINESIKNIGKIKLTEIICPICNFNNLIKREYPKKWKKKVIYVAHKIEPEEAILYLHKPLVDTEKYKPFGEWRDSK